MRKSAIILTAIFLIFISHPNARAANFTSVMSGAWNDAATWGGVSYPGSGDSATISPGHNVVVGAGEFCSNLTIQNSAVLSGAGSINLLPNGGNANLVNNGTMTVANVVLFLGDAANRIVNLSGAGAWTPNQLSVNSNATAVLTSNLTIGANTLAVGSSGTLNLNNFTLTFLLRRSFLNCNGLVNFAFKLLRNN